MPQIKFTNEAFFFASLTSPSFSFWVNKSRMLSAVGWPHTSCNTLPGLYSWHARHCLHMSPKASGSCCDLLIHGVQIIQLLCQRFEVKSLIMTSQASSIIGSGLSFTELRPQISICSQQTSSAGRGRLLHFAIAKQLSVQGHLRFWIEFRSKLKAALGKKCELLLRAITHYQPVPVSPVRIRK